MTDVGTISLLDLMAVLERGLLNAKIRIPVADLDALEVMLREAGPTKGNEAAFEDLVGAMMAALRATRTLEIAIDRYRVIASQLDAAAGAEGMPS